MDQTTTEPVLLRVDEAAQLLGCSRSRIYSLIWKKQIPTTKVLGAVRIPRQALLEWIATNTVASEG